MTGMAIVVWSPVKKIDGIIVTQKFKKVNIFITYFHS